MCRRGFAENEGNQKKRKIWKIAPKTHQKHVFKKWCKNHWNIIRQLIKLGVKIHEKKHPKRGPTIDAEKERIQVARRNLPKSLDKTTFGSQNGDKQFAEHQPTCNLSAENQLKGPANWYCGWKFEKKVSRGGFSSHRTDLWRIFCRKMIPKGACRVNSIKQMKNIRAQFVNIAKKNSATCMWIMYKNG